MATYLDKQFEKFCEASLKAMRAGEHSMAFMDQVIPIEYTQNDLEGLLQVIIDGKPFQLVESLENKSKLAAEGYLGQNLVAMGKRCLEVVQQRQRRDAKRNAWKELKEIWGQYTKLVWDLHRPEVHSRCIGATVVAILQHVESKGTDVPKTLADARKQGIKFPFTSSKDWSKIQRLVRTLLEAKGK